MKLKARVLCAVGLSVVALAACGDLTPTAQKSAGASGSGNMSGDVGGSDATSEPTAGTTSVSTGGNAGDSSTSSGGAAGSVASAGSAGSDGSGGAGTGGTGGSSAGTLGAGGGSAGTSPIADPCAHTGPRTQTDLTPSNGRVTCASNDFGIEGDWKLNSSDPDLMTTNFTGAMVCGSGKIHQVIPTATTGTAPDFGRYWGGGLAFVMHNESAGAPALPYDALSNGLTGISVVISGATIPAQMRFKFKMIGINDSFCKEVDGVASGATVVLHTGEAVHDCWAPDTTATLDPTMIENYEVQVVSQTSGDVPFDFCLSAITALAN